MAEPDLDLALLRTFVSVAEAGGFTRAGERVHRTQSTVSQQIRRLEEDLGVPLFTRGGRAVHLTDDGERLLAYARRILSLAAEARAQVAGGPDLEEVRVGVPEDYAIDRLPGLLARCAAEHPGLRLHVRCDLSVNLLRDLENGELDLALAKQPADRPAPEPPLAVWREPVAWVAAAHLRPEDDSAVPLAVFPLGCVYRARAVHELEAAGRGWRIAYTSPNLAGIQAAVVAGLGVSVLPAGSTPPGTRRLDPGQGFPDLPDVNLTLHGRKRLGRRARAVADLLADTLARPVAGAGAGER